MSGQSFTMERLGVVMQPDPARPEEREGVLNPGVVRGSDDADLYLFPRLVAQGNYSRIGRARLRFDEHGNPVGVQRLGYALEPSGSDEVHGGTGGCEDPRVTYLACLGLYVMVYTAWGQAGPRLAIAVSEDLRRWDRLGIAEFVPLHSPVYDVRLGTFANKDGAFFPHVVRGPDGEAALAILHRPDYDSAPGHPQGVPDPRPSIWLSHCRLADVQEDVHALLRLRGHHVLIDPEEPWESLRIGAGAPPVLTALGWVLLYHGVSGHMTPGAPHQQHVRYCVGVLVLDADEPRRVLYRSRTPILEPQTGEETAGVVPNVVFPTGCDDRGDGRIDVYYGMADRCIGAARLHVPARLPT